MAQKCKLPPGHTDDSEHELPKQKFRDLHARFTKSRFAADLDLSLCPDCRLIDLDAVMEAASAGEDLNRTIIALVAPLTKVVPTSICRLCTFLWYDWLRGGDDWRLHQEYWQLCAFDSLEARGFLRTKARLVEKRFIVLVLVYPQANPYGFDHRRRLVLPYSWPRAAVQQPSASLYYAREICASAINYGLIKGWLRDCESGHKSCRLQRPMIKPAKLIDCVQRKVVSCTPRSEYLALSYVWGTQSESDKDSTPSRDDGKLPYQIPRAISDAMTLVLSLGYQYLWVDRFCIDQDNAEEKHDQISQMDDVYEGAIVTIVTASSKAAETGIPGISIPRVVTPCVEISAKISLQACPPSAYRSLAASEWNKRGWTYQEFCLSRRCLIFADDQVHFICRRGTTCEGVKEGALSNLPVAKWRCLDPSILENMHYLPPLFERHVFAYACRSLSYDSDKLNAFRGVLSRSQIASYWGVPVNNTNLTPESAPAIVEVRDLAPFHLGFSTGLCWTRDSWRSRARLNPEYDTGESNGLPSWSWVSCRGMISHARFSGQQKKNDENWLRKDAVKYFAEIYLDDPSGNHHKRLIALIQPSRDRSRMIPERSPFIYIRSVVKEMGEHNRSPSGMRWDSGNQPKCSAFPFFLILLVYEHAEGFPDGKYCCMVVKMEGDVARRVGLALLHGSVYSSLTSLGVKTIKVA